MRYIADWLTLLCGPLALPLTAYGALASSTAYNRLLFTALLVSCLIVASYRVWEKEFVRTLEAEFPIVQYPGGGTEFVRQLDNGATVEYVAARDLTLTNRSDMPASVLMYLQIARGPVHLMFSPENDPISNWRELAGLRDTPNSTQLTFPLSIRPRTSVGGHAIFLLSRNMRYGVAAQGAVSDEWFIYIKHLQTGQNRTFPINVVDRARSNGGWEVVYARA